eukprot:5309287-Prorocentrum_lima.AAC.1
MVQQASKEHGEWLELTPDQQAGRNVPFMFGDEFPIPPNGNALENHLRVEFVEAIPGQMQDLC